MAMTMTVAMTVPITMSLVGSVIVSMAAMPVMTVMIERAKSKQGSQRYHYIGSVIMVSLSRRYHQRSRQQTTNKQVSKLDKTRHMKAPR